MSEKPGNTFMVEVVLPEVTQHAVRWHIIQQGAGVPPFNKAVGQQHMKWFKDNGRGRYWVVSQSWKPIYGGFSFSIWHNNVVTRAIGFWKDPTHTALFLHQDAYRRRGSLQLQEVENVWYVHIRFRDFDRAHALKNRTYLRNQGFAKKLLDEWEQEPWFKEAEAAGDVPPIGYGATRSLSFRKPR